MEHLLEEHGVKATPNRLLVARALASAGRPLSLMELEAQLETIDKSAIFRTLGAFKDAHLVHVLEDSGEGVRYELCHSHHHDHDDDIHVHFYCTKCHRTFCLEDTPVPPVQVPEGYEVESVSYLLKGVCPECAQ
ncbi:MAG: transcriptional repressor [Bacteroidales bacterium]|jgi:Fur family ferric uptake transcriptional regulator|nr:transcriptional repressor [Bacteroidales bacterium]